MPLFKKFGAGSETASTVVPEDEKQVVEPEKDISDNSMVKRIVTFAVTGLVELFTGAVVNSVLDGVEGGKLARFGARIGGGLVGLVIGDKVADYVCASMDDISSMIEEIKDAIEEEEA